MNNPLITIVTVVYNGEDFIEETILSVINQTYSNIDYVIIDGGSTDKTIEIIKKYEDKLSFWMSEPDKGIYDAMNKGLNKAKGKWINFLNAGDTFITPNVLEKIFLLNLNEDLHLIYGDVIILTEKGKTFRRNGGVLNSIYSLRKGMNLCHQAIFYRTSNMKKYDANLKILAEWKHLIHMIKTPNFKYLHLENPIVNYRLGGLSATTGKKSFTEYKEVFLNEYGLVAYILNIPYFFETYMRIVIKGWLKKWQ